MKKQLLILHGALGAADQFSELRELLQEQYQVHTLNLSGHGGDALPNQPFSFNMFAEDVLTYMQEKSLQQVDIFGYSMGGFVALWLAHTYPERVNRIFTLATKFNWNPGTSEKEVKMLDPEKIKTKVPAFAQTLAQRHGQEQWEQVLYKTAELMQNLGQQNPLTAEVLAAVSQPVQVSVGDRDNMTSIEETVQVYRQLGNASLLVLPQTQHPFEKVNLQRLVQEINWFFN